MERREKQRQRNRDGRVVREPEEEATGSTSEGRVQRSLTSGATPAAVMMGSAAVPGACRGSSLKIIPHHLRLWNV